MKLKLVLFFLICYNTALGQDIDEFEIVGAWKVKNSETNFSDIPEQQQEYMKTINTAFKNAIFHFKADHHFSITIDFEDVGNQMKNAYWKLNTSESKVIVVDWNDKDSDEPSWEWPITITKEGGKTFFAVTDGRFVLEVQKE